MEGIKTFLIIPPFVVLSLAGRGSNVRARVVFEANLYSVEPFCGVCLNPCDGVLFHFVLFPLPHSWLQHKVRPPPAGCAFSTVWRFGMVALLVAKNRIQMKKTSGCALFSNNDQHGILLPPENKADHRHLQTNAFLRFLLSHPISSSWPPTAVARPCSWTPAACWNRRTSGSCSGTRPMRRPWT